MAQQTLDHIETLGVPAAENAPTTLRVPRGSATRPLSLGKQRERLSLAELQHDGG